jgi:type I restriction enzyme R subunit
MLNSPEAKASEMEHALRHEISIKLQENPVFYKSLKERLEQLIEARRQERIDTAEQLKLFAKLRDELVSISSTADRLGMTEDQFAFHNIFVEQQIDQDKAKELASAVVEAIQQLAVIDWQNKEDIQREMRRRTKQLLRLAGAGAVEETTNMVIDLARARFRG